MTILQNDKNFDVPPNRYGDDVESVLISKDSLQARIQKMADQVSDKYRDSENDLILVCVLKGAVFFITDFARALTIPSQVEFMAVSSYGNSTTSSGVVRILKDLDRNIAGRDVLIVEDIIDSGLTLSWLVRNLKNRKPKSLEVVTFPTNSSLVMVSTIWNATVTCLGWEPSNHVCMRRADTGTTARHGNVKSLKYARKYENKANR